MLPPPLPYTLEDRTGHAFSSDFDDVYDRLFLHVSQAKQERSHDTRVIIHTMNWRSSRHRDTLPVQPAPSVIMEFGSNKPALGTVTFVNTKLMQSVCFPMAKYLQKVSLFGGSLQRKFIACDGREYKWGYRTVQDQEWSCTSAENYLVAHYNLKRPETRAYDTSGNVLTIYEPFHKLATEILASLTIMRFIAKNNL